MHPAPSVATGTRKASRGSALEEVVIHCESPDTLLQRQVALKDAPLLAGYADWERWSFVVLVPTVHGKEISTSAGPRIAWFKDPSGNTLSVLENKR